MPTAVITTSTWPTVIPGPARSALCWSHARRKFFELADIAGNVRKNKPAHDISPVALEAVKRIDAIFDIEREINGTGADARLAVRQERSRPLVEDLHLWLLDERARMSKHNSVAKAIDYLMPPKGERWDAFAAFLHDGRIPPVSGKLSAALLLLYFSGGRDRMMTWDIHRNVRLRC